MDIHFSLYNYLIFLIKVLYLHHRFYLQNLYLCVLLVLYLDLFLALHQVHLQVHLHRPDRPEPLAELEAERNISAKPPRIVGGCLVLPAGLLLSSMQAAIEEKHPGGHAHSIDKKTSGYEVDITDAAGLEWDMYFDSQGTFVHETPDYHD